MALHTNILPYIRKKTDTKVEVDFKRITELRFGSRLLEYHRTFTILGDCLVHCYTHLDSSSTEAQVAQAWKLLEGHVTGYFRV